MNSRFSSFLPTNFILALILLGVALSYSAPKNSGNLSGPNTVKPGRLDSVKVHKLYLDGEFDVAIQILEATFKEKNNLAHGDSIFIFKHLGVMYAANYETREKGKYYMNQLLLVEPSARILDMYASDMIYMIFKNIQDEFMTNRARNNVVEAKPDEPAPISHTKNNPPKETSSSGHGHALYWVGAAGAVVVLGAVGYLVVSDQNTPVNKHQF